MDLKAISPEESAAIAAEALGLGDHSVNLLSAEGMAASLRRAASFLCPASPSQIIGAVHRVYAGLPKYSDDHIDGLNSVFRALLGSGDLLSLRSTADQRVRIYLGPLLYVCTSINGVLLTGIRPDGAHLAEDWLSDRIALEGHLRWVRSAPTDGVVECLKLAGFMEVTLEQWLRAPRRTTPESVIEGYQVRVRSRRRTGEIDGLTVLDTAVPVTNYRARWRSPSEEHRGTYVGRRPQVFGADLWCVVHFGPDGEVRLLDLPLARSILPAADAAWHLQAALDATAGRPQTLRLRAAASAGHMGVDLFSPLPSWAQRRLDISGRPVACARGALFSYQILHSELDRTVQFLQEHLWMRVVSPG
jgi:hypothetical protein